MAKLSKTKNTKSARATCREGKANGAKANSGKSSTKTVRKETVAPSSSPPPATQPVAQPSPDFTADLAGRLHRVSGKLPLPTQQILDQAVRDGHYMIAIWSTEGPDSSYKTNLHLCREGFPYDRLLRAIKQLETDILKLPTGAKDAVVNGNPSSQ